MQRNLSKSAYIKLLCGEKILELVPDGIRAISHHAVSFTKFTEIESIKVTPTHVFIFVYLTFADDTTAYIIPRTKVTEGDLNAFITDLKGTMHSTTNNQPVLGVS
jgi:hypothetical protein